MFSKSLTVLAAILSLAAGFAIRGDVTRARRDAPYRGPPAPLNHDGTVAFTSEFLQANDIHNAAYAEEYQRLKAAADLAAAHPDRTSPPSKDYNPQDNGQYNHHDNGQADRHQEDDGQYRPHFYENKESNEQYSSAVYASHQPQVSYSQMTAQQQFSPVSYNPAPYNSPAQHSQQQYSPVSYNPAPYTSTTHHTQQQSALYTSTEQHNQQQYHATQQNPQAHIPAPLNPDGTVAHTPEYLALASSLHNVYQQHAQTRHRRSLRYHGPPAPLNHDGTVANTPEIEHAIAVHKAAYALQYQKLHEAEMLAAAHPDLTSSEHYGDHSVGGYSQQYESHNSIGQYDSHLFDNGDYNLNQYNHENNMHYSQAPKYSPEAHIPAPLNHDGTVAHTAEYKAIAASHQAEYAKALQATKYHKATPEYQPESVFSNNYW